MIELVLFAVSSNSSFPSVRVYTLTMCKNVLFYFMFVCFCLFYVVDAQKVPVTVYYESLCMDSRNFFRFQLYPSLQTNLSKWIDLTLVPYGKSNQIQLAGDEWQFSCHHGPYECQGNKIQACALKEIEKYTPTPKDAGYNPMAVAFINCLMDKTENTTDSTKTHQYSFPTKQCAEINHVQNYADIENCSAHTIGSKYLVDLGLQTRTFQDPIKSVPTIVFNNVYKEKDSQEATSNFVTVLCKYITKDKPMECSGCTITPTVAMFILILTFIKFF